MIGGPRLPSRYRRHRREQLVPARDVRGVVDAGVDGLELEHVRVGRIGVDVVGVGRAGRHGHLVHRASLVQKRRGAPCRGMRSRIRQVPKP